MSSTHDLLRQAVEELAARIHEIVRAEVAGEVRAQLALAVAKRPPATTAIAPPPSAAKPTPLQRVLTFVTEHPGAMPKDIVRELRLGRPTVFKVLAEACAAGTLGKRGGGRTVQYFVGGLPALPAEAAPAPTRRPRAQRGTWRQVAEQVVAFVSAHPGCRYAEIQNAVPATDGNLQRALGDAKARGAIRMEGTRIKARYVAGNPLAHEPAKDEPAAPLGPVVTARVLPPLPEEERARADALLRELEQSLTDDMHAIRLAAVLQAIVAQVRSLQERVGTSDPLAPRLDYAIRRITAVRAERELTFITGLKRGATADWPALARRARATVEAYDRDAQEVPRDRGSRPAVQKPAKPRPPEESSAPAESFPTLRYAGTLRPVVLVGGIKKNEVLAQIEQRYGLSVEWTAAQGANVRAVDAFIERVKHGKLGAVVILEGLFGHSQVTPIVQALKANAVPYAYGDRAGTESIRGAFAELEETLLRRQAEAD